MKVATTKDKIGASSCTCSTWSVQCYCNSSFTSCRLLRLACVLSTLALVMICQHPSAIHSIHRHVCVVCLSGSNAVATAHPRPLNVSLFHRARSVSCPSDPTFALIQKSSHRRRCWMESPSSWPHHARPLAHSNRVEVSDPFNTS